MSNLVALGTTRMTKCFDEKVHECTVTDYLVKLYGDTYHNRQLMRELGLQWSSIGGKYWFKNVDSYEELEKIEKAIAGKSIKMYVKPIFRITDTATNPIAEGYGV